MNKEAEDKLTELLLKTELFKDFDLNEIKSIIIHSSIHLESYKRNSIIVSQGNMYNELHILVKGECISKIVDYNGRIIQIGHLKAPFVIAPAVSLSTDKISPLTIEAGGKHQSDIAQFIIIPEKDINYLLSSSTPFTRRLLSIVAERVISLSQRISFLTFNSIEEKFISYLATLKSKTSGEMIIIPVKLEDLASYFGVERPSLSRSIANLIKKGIIEKCRRNGKTAYRILRFL